MLKQQNSVPPVHPPKGFEHLLHHPPHQAWTHQVTFCQAEKPCKSLRTKKGGNLHELYQMFVIIWSLTSCKNLWLLTNQTIIIRTKRQTRYCSHLLPTDTNMHSYKERGTRLWGDWPLSDIVECVGVNRRRAFRFECLQSSLKQQWRAVSGLKGQFSTRQTQNSRAHILIAISRFLSFSLSLEWCNLANTECGMLPQRVMEK